MLINLKLTALNLFFFFNHHTNLQYNTWSFKIAIVVSEIKFEYHNAINVRIAIKGEKKRAIWNQVLKQYHCQCSSFTPPPKNLNVSQVNTLLTNFAEYAVRWFLSKFCFWTNEQLNHFPHTHIFSYTHIFLFYFFNLFWTKLHSFPLPTWQSRTLSPTRDAAVLVTNNDLKGQSGSRWGKFC